MEHTAFAALELIRSTLVKEGIVLVNRVAALVKSAGALVNGVVALVKSAGTLE